MNMLGKTLRHGMEFTILGVLRLGGWFIPFSLLPVLGWALGAVMFDVFRLQRRLTLHNLTLAFGEQWTPQQRLRIARRCYGFFGGVIMEVLALPRLARRPLHRHVVLENPQVMDEALAQGQGVILVSGHFGNWEWMGGALSRSGYLLNMYVGRQHNPLADGVLNRLRQSLGTHTIAEGAAMRDMLKALKKNGIVAMLSDQHYSRKIHFIHFFGRRVSTVPGPATLALRTGAALVFGVAIRQGWLRYCVRLEAIAVTPTDNPEYDILVVSQAISDRLEAVVRQYPEQYFWMHNRWKPNPPNWVFTPTNQAFLDQLDQR